MANQGTISDQLAEQFATGEADLSRNAQAPAIPPPGDDMASVVRSVRAIKAVVDSLTGASGSVLDRVLTLRDQLQEGTLAFSESSGLTGGAATSIITGGGSAPPVDLDELGPFLATPPTPANLEAQGVFRSVVLTWELTQYRNHAYVEVWRATSDNLGVAVRVAQEPSNFFTDADVTVGQTYWYWVRAVNIQAATGSWNAAGGTSASLLRIGTTDLADLAVTADKLANGQITAAKLANGTIEATNFAASIEPITIVVGASVPTTKSTNTIYLTGNGKLYRWNGTAYVASVPTSDLDGTISDAMLTGIAASKITGQLTDDKIAALDAAKLTGQIVGTRIADGAISTAKLQAGAVTANEIAGFTITADQIASNAITTAKLNAGAVTAAKIESFTITANQIAAFTITGDQIAANSVNADRLVAYSITAGQIQAGAIGVDQIAAGAIRTDKLLVTGRGAALNADPSFRDPSAWPYYAGSAAVFTTVTDGGAGTNVVRSGAANAAGSWVNSDRVPLDATKTYRVRALARRNSSANGQLYIGVALFDAAGGNIEGDGSQWFYGAANGVTPSTSWSAYQAEFGAGTARTFPANARSMAVLVVLNYAGTVGHHEAQDARIEEKANADLIVDGSIVATKLAANAIAVGSAVIQNGAIRRALIEDLAVDDAKIASLNASKITTGVLNANLIAAESLNADKITAGTITADRMQTGLFQANNVLTRGLTVRDSAGNIILSEVDPLAASRVTADPSWLNSNISISGGALTGIGTGAGTLVANALLEPSIAAAATTATWPNVTGPNRPENDATVGAPAGTPVAGNFPGGLTAATVETRATNGQSAFSAVNDAVTGLALRLRSNAQNVLSGQGGLATGTITWDVSGNITGGQGVGITAQGLVARNASGDTTFVLNGSSGAAVFAGALSAASGSFVGSTSVNGRTWSSGNGFWAGIDGGFARMVVGSSSQFLSYDGQTGRLELRLDALSLSLNGSSQAYGQLGAPFTYTFASRTVTATGGVAPYTYSWSLSVTVDTGNGNTLYMTSATNGATMAWAGGVGEAGGQIIGTATCTVADANGRVAFITTNLTLTENS